MYHLTSRTFAMGSLLTEGDHLFLDRGRDWRTALDLLLAAVAADAEAAGAPTLILRDLDAADPALADALRERGFVRLAMPDSLVVGPVLAGDETRALPCVRVSADVPLGLLPMWTRRSGATVEPCRLVACGGSPAEFPPALRPGVVFPA